ncbi:MULTISPECIES: FAD:protein FMN transferase [unclassified Clostridium]|uniref:FAD:protein FMN transferase n=1 Tax=unclassified Clostridium TaxID=2614128 RepID=UPI00029778FC|nr:MULTISPECIES: FAD:protein FMN transferase [unclassified Clostridium]EKQ55469.1 MAG: membrane-associated lipoprotein involved in thiamine biosynthesis [Clostridium sp. Maddingley MBC34-26]
MVEFEDFEFFCMGTNVIQRIYSVNAKKIAILVENELKRLENLMSFYISYSDVGRLNSEAGQAEVPLSKETFEVIKKAKDYSELCNGAFDITIAPLVKLWGIFSKDQRVPSKNEINNILSLTNYKDIILNIEKNSAKLSRVGQKIDLGAIAKGYAADRIIDIYKKNSVESGFINIGGNVLTLGNKPDSSPWSIGIQNPFQIRGEFIGIVKISDETVVTSGDYVRYFEKDKIRYHHILDPRTGYPAKSDLISATIIGKSSIEADSLSTAIFILGLREGMELVNKIDDIEAIFITSGKKVFATKGAKEKFSFIDASNEFEYIEDTFL